MIKNKCRKVIEFIRIAKHLNTELGILPLLFGSLGLQQYVDEDLQADDIDILVPGEYVQNKWFILKSIMESLGYDLVDEDEHKFKRFDRTSNEKFEVGIAIIESLAGFAGIQMNNIGAAQFNNTEYKFLSIKQYLKVYSASVKDSYRADKNNCKDERKILILKKYC